MSETAILLSKWLLGKIADKGFDLTASKIIADQDDIDNRFSKCIAKTSKIIAKKYPDVLDNNVEHFFTNKGVYEELIRLLFKNAKFDIEKLKNFFDSNTLPENYINDFVTELKKEVLSDIKLNNILSNNEIYLTIIGIGEDVEKIANNTLLSGEEIQKIRLLLQTQFDENFNSSSFKQIYKEAALNVLTQVNFIGLGVKSHIKKNRKQLKDIFIEPKLTFTNKEFYSSLRKISYDDYNNQVLLLSQIFNGHKNLVILGDPGAGKSMLVKRLVCGILENDVQLLEKKEIFEMLPFRIELRKYLQFKKLRQKGIVNYLIILLEIEFGIANLTEKNVNSLLRDNKLIFFFDGLDEIYNVHDKIEIKNDVENFLKANVNTSAVITSRIIGYEDAKLDDKIFCEERIENFDDEQIKMYVSRWYFQEEPDEDIRTKEVNEFLKKRHQLDDELLRNPLLLSLIVILFRNNLKLPESKLEIYQSCTKTLVEKWDLTKELNLDLDEAIEKKKESLFADLAYWQYVELSSKNINITNERVKSHLEKVIVSKHKLTEDYVQAEIYAEDFLNYALKRSLYFDNNFTHKTFLEYFTAYWIYSNVEKKHKLADRNTLLNKYISNSFWSIVLELLFNLIDQDQPDTEVMDEIFDSQIKKNRNAIPFCLSVLPSIKNVSPAKKRFLIFQAFKEIVVSKSSPGSARKTEKELSIKIFENVVLNAFSIDLAKQFMQTLDNKNEIIKFHVFIFEKILTDAAIDDVDFNFLDNDVIINLIKESPYLYLLYSYFFRKNRTPSTFIKYVDIFGIEYFSTPFEAYFTHFSIHGISSAFTSWMYNLANLRELETVYDNLKMKGLSDAELFKAIEYNHFYGWQANAVQIEELIDLINLHAGNEISKIYICLLWMTYNYQHSFKKKIITSPLLKNEVKSLLREKSLEKMTLQLSS